MESPGSSRVATAEDSPKLEVSLLNVEVIRTDGGTQNRATDPSVVRQYAALMMEGTQFPPLRVWFDGAHYWLTDGFHRIAAATKCGFKEVRAEICAGTLNDAIWDSFCTNANHGLRRKRADITLLIERALKHPRACPLSNVEISKHLGIPEPTVRRWRRRLSSSHDDDRSREVTRKGTTYILHLQKDTTNDHNLPIKRKSAQQLKQELTEARMSSKLPEMDPFLNEICLWIEGQPITGLLTALEELMSQKHEQQRQGENSSASGEHQGRSKCSGLRT